MKTKIWVLSCLTLVAIITLASFLVIQNRDQPKKLAEEAVAAVDAASAPVDESTDTVQQEEEPEFDNEAIQKVLDAWIYPTSSKASVTVTDSEGEVVADLNSSESYFAASIYKIYVAYEGYLQVDRGEVDLNETYVNGHTRGECLDLMIRESYSPCAEKLWVEIGKQKITDALVGYGIDDTSMTGLSTTSSDAAKMLQLIYTEGNLSEASRGSYLQSMKTQVYRSTLNKGFSNDVTVYNKIGFNELNEYHDTAILELKDGRVIIVSVLTNGVGTSRIVQLAKDLEQAFLAQ